MVLAGNISAQNRTKINRLCNGDTPNTEEEAREQNLKTNANFLEAQRIISNATNQISNAFSKGQIFFKVVIENGPENKRNLWSAKITKEINKLLKRSREYKCAKESAFAQVALHGPGAILWPNQNTPIPLEAGIEDVILPAGTLCSMANLDRFAIRKEFTWSQLYDMSSGPNSDKHWNKPYVTALLATLYDMGLVPVYQGNRWLFPEKLYEDVKEGMAMGAASSLSKVVAYDFFYRDDKSNKWNRRMVIDYANIATASDKFIEGQSSAVKNKDFLYVKDGYANEWSEIIHWYIGNCSNVAPYRYYSIRSIGYLLYGICMIQNKLRCRLFDHMFQQLLTLFRNVSDDNREKLQMIDLQNFGVMPDGVSMVPAQERHVADWNLIMMGLNQGRQLMAESASSFVPDTVGEGNRSTMTATETLVRQNTAVSLTSAVLNQLGNQSEYEYREICRRFCIKDNPDPLAKKFRECLKKAKIPLDILDIDEWQILPEQTVGGGNKSVELTITQALMQEIMPLASPDGQRLIARRRYLALTDNPDESELVLPDPPAPPSNDVQYAQMVFPQLMIGLPVVVADGVNPVTYTAMLLQLMNPIMQQTSALMQSPDSLPIVAERLSGLSAVGMHCEQEIQQIARDKAREPQAKQLFQVLTQYMAQIQQMSKAVMAQEQQKAQQQGGIDPETQAKLQAIILQAQTQSKIQADKAAQKQQEKDFAFHAESVRKDAATAAEIQRGHAKTQAEIAAKDITTQAEVIRGANEPKPAMNP